jgi:glutaminase
VSVCTVDGQRFDVGDVGLGFSIQSCVKPLAYAVAVEDIGVTQVHQHVGCAPSGVAFNEISLNDDNLPHNPMVRRWQLVTVCEGVCVIGTPAPIVCRWFFLHYPAPVCAGR